MSWGADGVMGEQKSPLGILASAASFPLAFGQAVVGVPATMLVARKLVASLFPVTLGHSGLGVPCFLLLLPFMCACSLSFVLVRTRPCLPPAPFPARSE
jgi:ribose/xylose/arabinose/galactoside ABC-type transport system permease subunit